MARVRKHAEQTKGWKKRGAKYKVGEKKMRRKYNIEKNAEEYCKVRTLWSQYIPGTTSTLEKSAEQFSGLENMTPNHSSVPSWFIPVRCTHLSAILPT